MEKEVGRSYRPFSSFARQETGAWGGEGSVNSRVQGLLKLLAGRVCVNNTEGQTQVCEIVHGWKWHEKPHSPKTWIILSELETIQPSLTLDDIPSPPRIWREKIIFSISFSPNPRSPWDLTDVQRSLLSGQHCPLKDWALEWSRSMPLWAQFHTFTRCKTTRNEFIQEESSVEIFVPFFILVFNKNGIKPLIDHISFLIQNTRLTKF